MGRTPRVKNFVSQSNLASLRDGVLIETGHCIHNGPTLPVFAALFGGTFYPYLFTVMRTQFKRRPARGSHDERTIWGILDSAFVAHVGFVVDGQPYVIPTLFGRCENTLYLHGSAASRMLRHLETGAPTCVTVTQVDGLVLARSAFHHSMNYRSVVAFGSSRLIRDEKQKAEALRIISEHLIRGRWDEVRVPNSRELSLTSVIEFTIEEAGAKLRTGPPLDDVEDCQLPVWAGVLPLSLTCGDPIPDPQTRPDQKIAVSLSEYRRRLAQKRNVTETNPETLPFSPLRFWS